MRFVMAMVFFSSVLAFGIAPAAEYWPMQDGLIWRYGAGTADDFEMTMECVGGACTRGYTESSGQYSSSQSTEFYVNADGDVAAIRSTFWSTGAIDPDLLTFNPPLVFLDLPLEVGKRWYSVSGPLLLIGEVLREEVVEVPAGTYSVMVVSLNDITNSTWLAGTYYLERSIGPVKYGQLGLSSFNGTVGVSGSSWGSLKALFR